MVWTAPRPDVDRLYAAADLVALPARYEPFGNVHLEALASGVPVLSSVHAGGAELIRNGVKGGVAVVAWGPRIAVGVVGGRAADAGSLATQARASAEPYPYAAQAERFEALYRRNPAFH